MSDGATMLAAKKTGPAAASIVSAPVPDVGRSDVLVAVRACAICASDLWGWSAPVRGSGAPGEWDPDNLGITGHEVAGDIVAVGGDVDPNRVGEGVWIDPIAGCGECDHCRAPDARPSARACRSSARGSRSTSSARRVSAARSPTDWATTAQA